MRVRKPCSVGRGGGGCRLEEVGPKLKGDLTRVAAGESPASSDVILIYIDRGSV